MNYFSDRVPTDITQSVYFHFGYHDAKLELTKRMEPLIGCLLRGYSNFLTEDELNPEKDLIKILYFIFEYCLAQKNVYYNICSYIENSRKNGKIDQFKNTQTDIHCRYSDIHESYTLMESKLRKIESEKEQLEISNKRLIQQKSDLEKILIKQQDRLDGVN